ncbi:MAG: ceramidase domain-containing protein [Methylococcales bacterium]
MASFGGFFLPFSRQTTTLTLLIILGLLSLVLVFGFVPPIPQDPAYHDFAPSKLKISNIPNTFNVITNIPFAIVGLWGLIFCRRLSETSALWSWRLFFSGIALTSIGSAYYHWDPNDATLAWDRLPMTIAFTSLFVALLSEQIGSKLENFLLIPLIAAGISSVVYWRCTGDLRAYGIIQFFPLIALPPIILILPERYDTEHYLFWALIYYIAAKLFEANDHETWKLIGFSGHALKHLLAACSSFSILWMLIKRRSIIRKS